MDFSAAVNMSCEFFGSNLSTCFSWENFKSLLNSAFTTSLIGALAGAYAGARAAQHIADRSKTRDDISKEINNINAAITILSTLTSSLLNLKKQHVLQLLINHKRDYERLLDIRTRRSTGQLQGNAQNNIHLDLQSLPKFSLLQHLPQEIIFTKISVAGRPLSLAYALSQSTSHLNDFIEKRNILIEDFKKNIFPQGAKIEEVYFGIPRQTGQINTEYPDTLNAIRLYLDDSIFFASLLCEDLEKYGKELLKTNRKILKNPKQRIANLDLSQPRKDGLIPDKENYKTWFTSFRSYQPRPWWARILGK